MTRLSIVALMREVYRFRYTSMSLIGDMLLVDEMASEKTFDCVERANLGACCVKAKAL